MKIYFTTSARGSNNIAENSKKIYSIIHELGHSHLDNFENDMDPKEVYEGSYENKNKRYKDAVSFISKSDVVILEVSTHSFTMGFLMHLALEAGKPVIALHEEKKPPAFAEGMINNKLQIWEYDKKNIFFTLKEALTVAQNELDLRFNLFLPSYQYHFLKIEASKRNIPKSTLIRDLIDKEIKQKYTHLESSFKIE